MIVPATDHASSLESMMKLLQQLVLILILSALSANTFAKPAHHAHGKSKAAKQEQAAPTEQASAAAQPAATPTPAPAVAHAVVGNGPVPPPPNLDAKSWLLMDYTTGQVLA